VVVKDYGEGAPLLPSVQPKKNTVLQAVERNRDEQIKLYTNRKEEILSKAKLKPSESRLIAQATDRKFKLAESQRRLELYSRKLMMLLAEADSAEEQSQRTIQKSKSPKFTPEPVLNIQSPVEALPKAVDAKSLTFVATKRPALVGSQEDSDRGGLPQILS